jgi:hypothetical protein
MLSGNSGPSLMNHPLRCRCGTLQGVVVPAPSTTRIVCYCRDCQAYARFLGSPGVVDPYGGTEIVASLPRHAQFTNGQEMLSCLSLSERGLLRWYASCCNTPVGNTPRSSKVAYVGLVHSCLEAHALPLEMSFGPLRMAVNTKAALGEVRSSPLSNVVGFLGLVRSLLGARLSGAYKDNPFFLAESGSPVRPVHVLSAAERSRAYGAG